MQLSDHSHVRNYIYPECDYNLYVRSDGRRTLKGRCQLDPMSSETLTPVVEENPAQHLDAKKAFAKKSNFEKKVLKSSNATAPLTDARAKRILLAKMVWVRFDIRQ